MDLNEKELVLNYLKDKRLSEELINQYCQALKLDFELKNETEINLETVSDHFYRTSELKKETLTHVTFKMEYNYKLNKFCECHMVVMCKCPNLNIKPNFKIRCQNHILHCHKSILAKNSLVFQQMFENEKFQETINEEIEIVDFSVKDLVSMLRFLYHNTLNCIRFTPSLMLLCDKYEIAVLKTHLLSKIEQSIDRFNVYEFIGVAYFLNEDILRKKVIHFLAMVLYVKLGKNPWQEFIQKYPG